MFLLLIIFFIVVGFAVQSRLKSKFKQYAKEALSNGMSGAEIAQKMLEDHGIYDVKIQSVPGKLTDHTILWTNRLTLVQKFTADVVSVQQLWQHMRLDMPYNMPSVINGSIFARN